jgi:hypothetical protein
LNLLCTWIERCEYRFNGRMVSGITAHVAVRHVPAGPYHEHAPELPDISLRAGRAKARAQRAQCSEWQIRRKRLNPSASEACGAIGAQLRIHQERAVEFEVFAKCGSKIHGAVANDYEFGSTRSNLADLVAQLHDLLTTEQSTEVADEDENDRLFFPVRL